MIGGRLATSVPSRSSAISRSDAADLSGLSSQRAIVRLVVILSLSCMIFGRFVLPVGGSTTSLVGPIGVLIVGYGLARGLLTFDRQRVILYFIFVCLILLSAAANDLVSSPFALSISWMSMLQFLVLSAFATLAFTHSIDETVFFKAMNGCFAFIAAMGLLQFIAQFVGVSIFHFSDFLPARFLTEQMTGGGYNNEIATGFGSSLKSNGFFLAEPSIFSQFMAVAIAIEVLYFRRVAFLSLFVMALFSSVSGTGWLVLAVFIVTVGVSMGTRGILVAAGLLVGIGLAVTLWAVLLPDIFDTFIGRSDEIFSVGSSGHIRFVTPFWISKEILDRAPWALLFGVGSSVSERIWFPYEGGINTPVKIALENGVPVLLCYVLLISLGHQTLKQRRLIPALLVLLALAGGYSQFPPVLFLVLLINPVATLRLPTTNYLGGRRPDQLQHNLIADAHASGCR